MEENPKQTRHHKGRRHGPPTIATPHAKREGRGPPSFEPFTPVVPKVQDIALIEAFDPGGAAASGVKTGGTTNSAINGYVVGLDGIKYEGTVTLTGDKGFWCAGVDFTDKDN